MTDHESRWVVGVMSGTSLDGLDAALVRVEGKGLGLTAALIAHVARPMGDLADVLRPMAEGLPHPPIDFLRAARRLGDFYADGIEQLMAEAKVDHPIDLVAAHGQTI